MKSHKIKLLTYSFFILYFIDMIKIGIELNHRLNCFYDIDFIINLLNKNFICEKFNKKNINFYNLIICNNLNGSIFKLYLKNKKLCQKLLILPTSFACDYFNSNLLFRIIKNKKEQDIINNNIYAGITEYNNIKHLENLGSYFFNNRFYFPLLKFDLTNINSREFFFKKYNINPKLKLITFFDHRISRGWLSKNYKDISKYYRVMLNQNIIKNFKKIHDSFLKIGYKIIVKLYDYNIDEAKKLGCYKYYKDLLYYDLKEDVRYIYKYSSFMMIASPSSVMHISYLFNKKTLYIVDKFDWIKNQIRFHYQFENKIIRKKDILYGPILNDYEKLIINPKEVVDLIENYNNDEFLNNEHILYGYSKNININQYCQLLINKINQIKDN